MLGYYISGAGNSAVDGWYEDRGMVLNGKPSYTNGPYYLTYISHFDIGEMSNVLSWVITTASTDSMYDLGAAEYYQIPYYQATPDAPKWFASAGAQPAPLVEPVMEVSPPNPLDALPWPEVQQFPEPELYPTELDPVEPMPHLPDDDYALWAAICSDLRGSSTFDIWRNGVPFIPAKYIDTRDFSAWRAGSPFIRWIDDLPPQVSRNPALRKVRTFRHGPKIVVIGG